MSNPLRSTAAASSARCFAFGLAAALLFVSALTLAGPSHASWLDRLAGAFSENPKVASDPLGDALSEIDGVDVAPPGLVLAATVTAEGHWTFANQAGQRFTAANDKEMARVYASLAPDITGSPGPVVIYVASDTIGVHQEHLNRLPEGAKLRIVTAGKSYPLRALRTGTEPVWFAEVANNVLVRASDAGMFTEAVAQLNRPLRPKVTRILALDPEGPDTFRPVPELGTSAEGRRAVDKINPEKLASALATLRRQTAVITGRLQGGDRLVYRSPKGIEHSLDLGPVRVAAAAHDVNLVFVNATAPRQPGARNWLWLRVEVSGLVAALERRVFGEFLNALTGGGERLFVEAHRRDGERTELRVLPMREGRLEREPGTLSGVLAELVSEVAGNVQAHAVDADLVSMGRQRELDRRLVPGVPAVWQWGLALIVSVGLMGLPVALSWYRALWPPEQPGEYPNRTGYQSARAVRWAMFALIFLPIAGIPAVIWGLGRLIVRLFGVNGSAKKADGEAATG